MTSIPTSSPSASGAQTSAQQNGVSSVRTAEQRMLDGRRLLRRRSSAAFGHERADVTQPDHPPEEST